MKKRPSLACRIELSSNSKCGKCAKRLAAASGVGGRGYFDYKRTSLSHGRALRLGFFAFLSLQPAMADLFYR